MSLFFITHSKPNDKSLRSLYFAIYQFFLCCTISGIHHVSNVTTGQPHAMLSSTTRGKLSASVGYKKQSAAQKYKRISVLGTYHISRQKLDTLLFTQFHNVTKSIESS